MEEFARTAKDLKYSETYLSTGCDKIDKLLRGGISKKGITEIYGEAGCGKTQLALQLCLSAQKDPKTYILYVCTESIFPSKRLQELLKSSPISKKYKTTSDSILVEHVSSVRDLEICILQKINSILSNRNRRVGLIIIDSIAAAHRVEYEEKNLKIRAKSIRTIGYALHNYSRLYNLSIVCLNQVSAVMNSSIGSHHCERLQPTLGLIWAGQVTNSICLCKFGDERHIHIRESPFLPRSNMLFEITNSGLHGLEELL